jgi:hypothetical protein
MIRLFVFSRLTALFGTFSMWSASERKKQAGGLKLRSVIRLRYSCGGQEVGMQGSSLKLRSILRLQCARAPWRSTSSVADRDESVETNETNGTNATKIS